MSKQSRILSGAVACALFGLSVPLAAEGLRPTANFSLPLPLAAKSKSLAAKPNAQGQSRYIVRLNGEPLPLYRGGVPGLAATLPKSAGVTRLEPQSSASQAYRAYLQQQIVTTQKTIEQRLNRAVPLLHTFSAALHGFVAELTPTEAERVARLPGVSAVQVDQATKPHTDRGPRWINAPAIWKGVDELQTRGEGVVVGVMDTGINPANPSFADIGGDGYDHTNPKGRYFGVCDSGSALFDPKFTCNDKLIGAYDFTGEGHPLDIDGHGSHTASTAAGNVTWAMVDAPTTQLKRRISGVAPHANLISYRVCRADGCWTADELAAIEQAILDGVDIINHSVGGTAVVDSWTSLYDFAFLAARAAGILVVNSAGNNGPGGGTVGTPAVAPWLMTVGASTHDRSFNDTLGGLTRGDGVVLPDIVGRGITGSYGPAPLVYAGNVPNPNDTLNESAQCAAPYPAGTFHGEIVICDRGIGARVDKGKNVLAGGAGGMILVNNEANGDSLVADTHALPATHIGYAHGQTLKAWLAGATDPVGTISGVVSVLDRKQADIMASFSSRGPNPVGPDLLKPDLVAPGVDIVAAHGVDGEVKFGVVSGTSMASPHAAGAAALLKALHPDWSPDAIKSALMTTAVSNTLREETGAAAGVFVRGAGRIDLERAARAGLVLDETPEGYLQADPFIGGDPAQLNLASMAESACIATCEWRRTVRNPGTTPVTWTAQTNTSGGVALSVTPNSFTLAPGASQSLTIKAQPTRAAMNTWLEGRVVLMPDQATVPKAALPVALRRISSDMPTSLRLTAAQGVGSHSLAVRVGLPVTRLNKAVGMVPARQESDWLYQGDYVYYPVNVPEGTRRLVAETLEGRGDFDLYILNAAQETVCSSAASGTRSEYCNLDYPAPGVYYIGVLSYSVRNPGLPEPFSLRIGVVGNVQAGDFRADVDKLKAASGDTLNVRMSWNFPAPTQYWYGALDLGTDGSHPGNLGKTNIDIVLAP